MEVHGFMRFWPMVPPLVFNILSLNCYFGLLGGGEFDCCALFSVMTGLPLMIPPASWCLRALPVKGSHSEHSSSTNSGCSLNAPSSRCPGKTLPPPWREPQPI